MASWQSWASPFPRPPSPSIGFAIACHRPILGGAFSIINVKDLVSLDFFTLPTATFKVLFVFIVLRHDRRRIVHFNVTEHPSAEWTAQQMVDAFPWDTAPRYLVRDRDQSYGAYFDTRVDGLGIEQVLTREVKILMRGRVEGWRGAP